MAKDSKMVWLALPIGIAIGMAVDKMEMNAETKTFEARRRRRWWRKTKNTANRIATGTKSNLKKTESECEAWRKLSPSEGGPSNWWKFRCKTKGAFSLGSGGNYTTKQENRYVRNKYGCKCGKAEDN